jgi:glycosyltransferase involved in cell wall biosynthesis
LKIKKKWTSTPSQKPEFAVIVPSYNNAKWCQKNLLSIANQSYPYFHLYYIDDASTDETNALAGQVIASTSLKDKTTCIYNKQRKGALANYYNTIHTLEPHKIVVCVDGDDWLAHDLVLSVVASHYIHDEVWLTYGDFEIDPPGILEGRCEAIPEEVRKLNAIRSYSFVASHLKTFYAKLFQNIKKKIFS